MVKKKIRKKIKEGVKCNMVSCCSGSGGGVYFLGFLGAAIYYVSTATGLWDGAIGLLKALAWPAFLVFELLKSLAA